LTYQSDDRRGKPMLFTCGLERSERAAARTLADLGDSALPEIERALDLIEKDQQQSKFAIGAPWLLAAYARVLGTRAYPRLRRMMNNPDLSLIRLNLDYSVALSLGLTSYVSGHRPSGEVFHCTRHEEPRDALDELIIAWESNSRPALENRLGPHAKAALAARLRARTWEAIRTDVWRSQADEPLAVGYQFQISGRWAEPEETLEQQRNWGEAEFLLERQEFRLYTFFKDRFGKDCGAHYVRFAKVAMRGDSESPAYVIDNPDLGALLDVIASCSARRP
jgi:hypothetical protein